MATRGVGVASVCTICHDSFESKSKLFRHLSEAHGLAREGKPLKVVLLVGWISEVDQDSEEWQKEGPLMIHQDVTSEYVEMALARAVHAFETGLTYAEASGDGVVIERLKGLSR
jgi:hypothetical protein